jgi:hypothetical protein
MHVAPALLGLLARCPNLGVEMVMTDRLVDLVEERFLERHTACRASRADLARHKEFLLERCRARARERWRSDLVRA